ncbi:hypothetical protein Tco_1075625 [Tanacetum coccineum]
MTAIFHDMVEDFMEVFMDDFSVFGNSFDCCLANLDRMLARCEETNLVLNWEKCHFMVKEGIVLGHKISGAGIEVDRTKIDVIAKLPYPTKVKGVKSFLGHAGFYRRIDNDHHFTKNMANNLPLRGGHSIVDPSCDVQFRRTSLIGFPAQSVRSSNAIALASPYLLILITGMSQSRHHVDTSLIHLESCKLPTKSLFDVGSRRISIVTMNTKEYNSDVLAIITRIMCRTY